MSEVMVDDRERLKDGPNEAKDDITRQNLEAHMPHNMEKEWRLYNGRGYLDQSYSDKKKLLAKTFDPVYVPCPWPVKKDENRGWTSGNTKRCNHVIPLKDAEGNKLTPMERQGLAEIHCRAHLDYYFERYSYVDDGGVERLPNTTKIYPPMWATDGIDPTATKREQVRMRVEKKLAMQMIEEQEADEQIAEEINKLQAEKEEHRRAIAKGIIEGAAVPFDEEEPPKRKPGRPKKED